MAQNLPISVKLRRGVKENSCAWKCFVFLQDYKIWNLIYLKVHRWTSTTLLAIEKILSKEYKHHTYNLVLSTGLIMWIGHHKEIKKTDILNVSPISSPEPKILLTCLWQESRALASSNTVVCNSWTSRWIWQIWLVENTKRILWTYSKYWV